MRRHWISVALTIVLGTVASIARGGISSTAQWTLEGTQNSAELGWSVATAGDVNGDGYSDVIVGEPLLDVPAGTNGGRARVFYGGPLGIDATADWSISGASQSQFGYWVSTAGDVNGDGYDDVIVGAPYYSNGNANEGAAWLYLGSASGLSTTHAWSREGGQDGARLGWCVSTAGDVNGDGYDDVIIGAPFYTNNLSQQGRAQIFVGGPTGLSTSVHRTIEGSGTDDAMGWAVATAGDVNGDGYDDVLVSAIYYEGLVSPTDQGAVYCYHGSASGVDPTADWSDFGSQADEYLGSSLSLAGDTNGDGFSDVLVGAGSYDNGQTGEGHVLLYAGGFTGLGNTPLHEWESNQADAYLGDAVGTAGDVNGDGYADVILGAHNFDAGQEDEGQILVYYGSPSGPGSVSVFNMDSDEAFAGLGWSVGTAGDVNGDGRSDIVAGTPFLDAGGFNRGRAQVFLAFPDDYTTTSSFTAENNEAGAAMGICAGFADVNGDGFSDLLGSSWFYDAGETNEGRVYCWHGGTNGISNPAAWYKDGNQVNAYLGRVIASAGDVNGDGYEDVVVTAPGYDDANANAGRAWVYNGSASGLLASPSWTARGQQADDNFGWAAASAGDVNGDGYADVVVGAQDHDNPQVDEGAAFLFLGSSSGLQIAPTIGWEGNQTGAGAGFSVACAGDVNGDGYSDILSGAPMFDDGQVNEGATFVLFGSGNGLSNSYSQLLERNQTGAKFGIAVSSAGDVNADGYSDIVVGASGWTNGESMEGSIAVYLGGPTGLASTPVFTYESNSAGANLGEWVGFVGDVNGDGYSDFAAGAPLYGADHEGRVYVFGGASFGVIPTPLYAMTGSDGRFGEHVVGGGDVDGDGYPELVVGAPDATNGQSGEGRLYLYHGNRHTSADFGAGLARQLHMRLPDDSAPLALLGRSDSENEARIRMLGRSAFGRGRVRAAYEAAPLGAVWAGNAQHTPWLDSGSPISGLGSRVGINQLVSGLSGDTPYHWRARFEAESPYFPRTPWFSLPGNGPTEEDFRTFSAPSAIAEPAPGAAALRFDGIFPNPISNGARIRFRLADEGHVRLTLHDASGRRCATIYDGEAGPGAHEVSWDGKGPGGDRLAPGVYFARLEAGGRVGRARVLITASSGRAR